MWWGMPMDDGGYDSAAFGHLGQRIWVFPQDDLIIVRFGISDEGVDSWDETINTVAADHKVISRAGRRSDCRLCPPRFIARPLLDRPW